MPRAKKPAGEWRWHPTKPLGRPPRNRVAAAVKITVRVTPSEHRSFREAAGEKAVSAWLRDLGKLCAAGHVRVLKAP